MTQSRTEIVIIGFVIHLIIFCALIFLQMYWKYDGKHVDSHVSFEARGTIF